jgi:hypothetical protein
LKSNNNQETRDKSPLLAGSRQNAGQIPNIKLSPPLAGSRQDAGQMPNKNPNSKYQKNQKTILEIVIVGIFKALWWLVKLPFEKKKKSGGLSTQDKLGVIGQRQAIEKMLQSTSEIELKHAVIEADKLVDHVLKAYGADGDTFADRLRSSEKNMNPRMYHDIWEGHKVRNQIAHEQNLTISNEELKIATEKLLQFIRSIN